MTLASCNHMYIPRVRIFTRDVSPEWCYKIFCFYITKYFRGINLTMVTFCAEAGPQRSHWATRTPRDAGERRHRCKNNPTTSLCPRMQRREHTVHVFTCFMMV